MATQEPLEDQQNHGAGDEGHANKQFNNNNSNNDTLIDRDNQDSNDLQQDEFDVNTGIKDVGNQHRNGQAARVTNISNESNDTFDAPSTSATSGSANNSPATTPASQHEQHSLDALNSATPQSARQPVPPVDNDAQIDPEENATMATAESEHRKDNEENDDDEELEEGELKDDDDDDDSDDDIPADNNNMSSNNRFSSYNNDNNDSNNNSGLSKDAPFNDQRSQHDTQNNSGFSARGGGHQYRNHNPRRHMSPNNQPQHHPGMHPQYPPNQFGNNPNDDPYRFQPNHDGNIGPPMPGMPPQMVHHPMAGPPGGFPRGGPGGPGPVQKVNVRCRFYSRTSNKCTWGDHCRFEHRDDSPGPNDVFDDRMPGGPPGMGPGGPMRGPPQPPMGGVERGYPPYAGRHQPYPMPPHPYGYNPYEQQPYGPPPHHSASPPLPQHPMPPHHWRQQHSPYPSPSSSNHPPESVSPSLNPAGPPAQAPIHGKPPSGGAPVPGAPPAGGSPGYSSPSSSAVYERKHRLAYELAPWNERPGYPPASKYDRDPAGGYPPPQGARGGGYYGRNHYSRDPYGREPMPPHMGGGPHPYSSSGYPPNYPPAYRGGPMGPHASHYRYSSSSQRAVPPDSRRSRSNKRGHDEDESSWSDSGSEDSILGQASVSKNSANKIGKKHQRIAQIEAEESSPKEPTDQGGSGTPPGEPVAEDRERQEMLLNKLKEIEDLMAKKKGEQEDPM